MIAADDTKDFVRFSFVRTTTILPQSSALILLLRIRLYSLHLIVDAERASSANNSHVDSIAANVSEFSQFWYNLRQLWVCSGCVDDTWNFGSFRITDTRDLEFVRVFLSPNAEGDYRSKQAKGLSGTGRRFEHSVVSAGILVFCRYYSSSPFYERFYTFLYVSLLRWIRIVREADVHAVKIQRLVPRHFFQLTTLELARNRIQRTTYAFRIF